jgi:hypothetical protein
MMTFTASLNQKGIQAEQDAFRRFHQELGKIYNEPEHRGETHCFAVACMDSFSILEEDLHETP